MKVILARPARRDLVEAVEFIARDDPNAADRLIDRVEETGAKLLAFPALGIAFGAQGLRVFAVPGTPYRLVYRVSPEGVTILRIWHGARKWPPPDA